MLEWLIVHSVEILVASVFGLGYAAGLVTGCGLVLKVLAYKGQIRVVRDSPPAHIRMVG